MLTSINATIGQYIEPQQTIAEIIDPESFQIKLSVFEKDINKLKPGQPIDFYSAGNKSLKHTARLISVGRAIMPDTRSIECYADMEDLSAKNFVNQQFVEGDVIVNEETVLALPETALLNSENEFYLLSLENETSDTYYFSKVKLKTGRINNKFVELLEVPETNKILVNGVYNLIID